MSDVAESENGRRENADDIHIQHGQQPLAAEKWRVEPRCTKVAFCIGGSGADPVYQMVREDFPDEVGYFGAWIADVLKRDLHGAVLLTTGAGFPGGRAGKITLAGSDGKCILLVDFDRKVYLRGEPIEPERIPEGVREWLRAGGAPLPPPGTQ